MANKRINATVTIGGAITSGLGSALETAKSKLNQVGDAVRKLEREQAALNKQINSYVSQDSRGLAQLITKHAAVTRELEKQNRLLSAKKGMAAGKERMQSAGMALGAVGAIASVGFLPVMQAVNFEKAMLGVAKQVDGARDSSGKLTAVYFDMAKQIQLLGRDVPMATDSIADMVAAGARMGIAKDELIAFTRTAAMMAEAFELPAGQLAEQMGKIKGLFGLKTQQQVVALADSINYLDDNAISKGADIIDFMERVGGVAGSVKINAQQMAALGSTLLTLGERSETASTSVNAMVQKFASAETGTKKFKRAMATAGLDLREVQLGMQRDAQGTIMKIMSAINALPADKRLGVMVHMVGLEHSHVMAKLAGNVAEYQHQIEMAGSDKAVGSMGREFAARLGTTSAQWEIMKNRVSELGVNIGGMLLPAINNLLGVLGPVASKTAEWVTANGSLVGDIATTVGSLVGFYAAFQSVSLGIGAVTWAFNAFKLAMVTNPIGLTVALLGTSALLIYKNWEPIKYFFSELWGGITATFTKAIDFIMAKVEWVGAKWQTVKADLGFGAPGVTVSGGGGASATMPDLPKLQARGAAEVTNNQENNFTIYQQPGQSHKALVEELMRETARWKAKEQRGATIDGAGAQ